MVGNNKGNKKSQCYMADFKNKFEFKEELQSSSKKEGEDKILTNPTRKLVQHIINTSISSGGKLFISRH